MTIGPEPMIRQGHDDVYRGMLDGSEIYVKRLPLRYWEDPEKAAQVRLRYHLSPQSPGLTCPTDLMQGGRAVEALEPPENSATIGCLYRTPPAHLVLDPW